MNRRSDVPCSLSEPERQRGFSSLALGLGWTKPVDKSMPGDILVINTGSSSLKYAVFQPTADGPVRGESGQVDGIGTGHPNAPADHGEALSHAVNRLRTDNPGWKPAAAGHRVVHGGTRFITPAVVDAAARAALDTLIPLDPLHLPANLQGIDAAKKAFPEATQVACFDTAFHHGHPWVADTYGLPMEYHASGVRRYGFHGLSYESIVGSLRRLAPEMASGRVIVAHLGNGASLCAIKNGQSVEATMGFSVLDGVPMGTRCGQIDPGVLLYLLRERRMTVEQIEELLYKKSGLLGLSGVSSDMRDLLASDRTEARQAVEYFVYRVTMAIGSLVAALGGIDCIIFTGGIGEHAVAIRTSVLVELKWLGIELDAAANGTGGPRISAPSSRVSAWVVPTDEEGTIARHVMALV
jgi:acetate kinase